MDATTRNEEKKENRRSGVVIPLPKDRQYLVIDNLGLIGNVLSKMRVPNNLWEDAFSDCTITLIDAAKLFDESRGILFSTYAYRALTRAVISFRRKNSREYSDNDDAITKTLSDRAWKNYQEQSNKQNNIPTFRFIYLTERQKLAVKQKYWDGLTLEQVGEGCNLSREGTRQLLLRAHMLIKKELDEVRSKERAFSRVSKH